MRYLILAVLLIFSFPALAQDEGHTIRIIQEDGSVDVIDLRQSASEPEPKPAAQAPVEMPKAKAEPAPVKKAKAVPSKKSAPKKVVAVPLPAPKIVTPPPLPVQRKVAPSPSTEEEGVKNAPVQKSEIRRAQAISVALDYAPPSSDVEVYRSEYNGQRVFAVMFKIEDGYHEVLVDAHSGKVLESRKSDIMRAQPKPGHLPGSLQ
ncbi:MAG TPA: PepSY domain-containing protein [Alphaproteobacteria bacterium]|nr:PepSY domain-containing protein [Alphaproteobacteria bacterium]USO05861.1 MAG: PepSY domain-containing protein [Rhodospirillales bacterium]HOO82031.1 PepSY domain-containing protein [Alphaproteobacteria bacterium]